MLANFFEKTKPINSIVLSILFFVYYYTNQYLHQSRDITNDSWLSSSLQFLIIATFLLLSTFIFIKNEVSNDNLHNTFIIILLYGMFPNAFSSNNMLLVSIIFLLIYNNISQLKPNGRTQLSLYDSGILTGISFLLYEWSILFLIFIIIGILFAQRLNFKNIISPILGFLTPIILCFTYSFFTDNTELFFEFFKFPTNLNFDLYTNTTIQIPLFIFTFVVLISVFLVLPKIISINNPYRYQYLLTILMLFICFAAIALKSEKNGSEFLLIFFPASIIIGRLFKTITHQGIKEILFISLTACSVVFLFKFS